MLSLLFNRQVPAAAASTRSPVSSRLEVCPPRRKQPARRSGFSRWFAECFPALAARPSRAERRLKAVAEDFVLALNDLRGTSAVELRARVRNASSMRELWHLRSNVHHMIALKHGENEADIRLAYLGRHFPTRNPRSGFAPLDGAPR